MTTTVDADAAMSVPDVLADIPPAYAVRIGRELDRLQARVDDLEPIEQRALAMLTIGARPGETGGPAVLKRAAARAILGRSRSVVSGMQWGIRWDDGDLPGDLPTFQVCESRTQAMRRALAGGKARVVVRAAPGAWYEACARCGEPITDPERAPADTSALCRDCGDPDDDQEPTR